MSAYVILNLFDELRKRDKIRGSVEPFVAFSERV